MLAVTSGYAFGGNAAKSSQAYSSKENYSSPESAEDLEDAASIFNSDSNASEDDHGNKNFQFLVAAAAAFSAGVDESSDYVSQSDDNSAGSFMVSHMHRNCALAPSGCMYRTNNTRLSPATARPRTTTIIAPL